MTGSCDNCGAPYEPRCWQAPVGNEWWCADCVWQRYLEMEKEIAFLKAAHPTVGLAEGSEGSNDV